ncbi:uncharacterized protein FOMMEDRAFT_137738 [Fomitiporia mediterranea MF3/22]|uniref:uncharacterized protein n=1 Tax=Fomitiporia mediterranea (strain MF3/22) TaxID=694068 RepID=UPI0004409AEE|nr:uncharacterized protein FOMMEDRAFT_137738 [Fomitiporia mediterranea MF3/22]EJD07415.1 hypothetical protein FOMMEDRAFT_137738 [Fomitiporia mediterranea MF3/22]
MALPDGIPTSATFDGPTPDLPQSQPLPDHPTSFLLSDLRTGTKRKRDSSSLSTPASFVNDHSNARLRITSDIEGCFGDPGARVGEEVCVDCVVDCDDVDCPASCEEKCTEQCVVVPCNDKNACVDACTDACIEEVCPAEPCTGGVDCTASLDDTIQLLCCTDLHNYYVPTEANAAACQLNWDCTLDAFNQMNFPGYSQFPESNQQQITSAPSIPQEISGISSDSSSPHISFSDDSASGRGSSLATPSQTELSTTAAATAVQSLSQQQQQTSNEEFACRWLNCNASFGTLNELVGHVNLTHLRPTGSSSPPRPAKKLCLDTATAAQELFPLSCHWDDCHIYPDSSLLTGPSSGLQPEIAFDLLSTHFIHDHLGLSVPPQVLPQLFHQDAAFSSTLPNSNSTQSTEHATQMNNIISLAPNDVPTSGNNSQLGKAIAPVEPSYATPEPSPPPSNTDTSQTTPHDCATSSHICHWLNCNLSFPTCASLTSHLASAHVGNGKGRYDCFWGECGRSGEQGFTSKQKIMRHLQAHTGHRPYMCKECGQWFSEAATLQQHMRRHTQEKPFVCDFPGCGKAFAITGALTIHKRTHNGERPFQCPHCDRAFAESSNLSKHLRTHTGDRPYRCNEPGCGKAFARPDQLQRHGNVHSKKKAATAASGVGAGEVVASAGTPATAIVKSPA